MFFKEYPTIQVIITSYIYRLSQDCNMLKYIMQLIKEKYFDLEHSIYLYWQVQSCIFNNSSEKLDFEIIYSTYDVMYSWFVNEAIKLGVLQEDERNNQRRNTIVVTTHQLLSLSHGPTRNVLDHCYVLQKELKKDVVLVVTCEMPTRDQGNFIQPVIFNYSNMSNLRYLKYKDIEIEIYHPDIKQYGLNGMITTLNYIKQKRPYLVYNIGASSLISDACNNFATVATLPCSYNFPVSKGKWLILGREINEKDKNEADFYKLNKHEIIESTFTFELHPIKKYYERKEFNISNDKYLIAIVGTRLDIEIDQSYIKVIKKVLAIHPRIHIAFIGNFNRYTETISNDELLKERCTYLGFQKDLRGVLQFCDLYLNPKRKGGGTSGVEALAEGLPIVTLDECDVAYAVGRKYVCQDELEYINRVVYYFDKSKSDKGKQKDEKRLEQLLDTKGAIENMLRKIEEQVELTEPKHVLERIILNKEMVDKLETDILIRRHIERYALVRKYVFGKVIDVACGVGYGTYLMAKNPDVQEILGVDCNEESIQMAKENYEGARIKFCHSRIEDIEEKCDVLISLETIEHLEDPKVLGELAIKCGAKEVIVSFPHKKTTHYNKYHLWDIEEADVKFIFEGYECINKIIHGDSTFMHLIKRDNYVCKPKRYLNKRDINS